MIMSNSLQKRALHIQIFFGVAIAFLTLKMLQLQVLDSSFRKEAQNAAMDKVTVYPARGSVFDRNNELMVYNIPIYDLMVTYNRIGKIDTTKFCKILGISKDLFEKNLDKKWKSGGLSEDGKYSKSIPFPFLSRLSIETYARFQESMYEFPGFFVQLRYVRGYPHPNAAHALGYLREVNQEEIDKSILRYKQDTEEEVFAAGDYIGASGLEASYDKELRGKKGYKYILRDNLGREVGAFRGGSMDSMSRAEPGKDLITSIDLPLQQYCEELLKNKKGGIVAIEPSSGEILAMVSAPFYDPNLLVFNRERAEAYKKLNADEGHPFFNRAVMAKYPPGSLFKPIVALIALEEGATELQRTIGCAGGYFLNGRLGPGCHSHPTCTSIGMAIQHSCNAYFAHVFRNIVDIKGYTNPSAGLDIFNSHLDRFGLNRKLDIDFPQESKGNSPTSAYYNKIYKGENWYSPYIMSVGIGQGEMELTTIQMANLASIIANRGYYFIPHFGKALRKNGKVTPIYDKYRIQNFVDISYQYFEPVINGMEQVVQAGTARASYIPDIPICGKTGTAQNPHGEDHSIFFCFAPKDDPQIAVAVYVEHAGSGGRMAAPISSLIIEKYLKGKIAPERQYREDYVKSVNLLKVP